MGHKGETRPRTEDAWWGQLYDDDGAPDMGGAALSTRSDETLDEHCASALAAVRDAQAPPVPRAPQDDPAWVSPRADTDGDGDGAGDSAEETVRLRQRRTPTPAQRRRLPPSWAAREPGPGLPPPELPAPAPVPVPAAPWGVLGDGFGAPPAFSPAEDEARTDAETDTSADAHAWGVSGDAAVAPGPAEPWGHAAPEGSEPERRIDSAADADEAPRLDADADADAIDVPDAEAVETATPVEPAEPVVVHVGDRPPTYEGEPTAWPMTDPECLDEFVPDTVLDGAHYGLLTVRAASSRGDSARYRGRPRRDALLTVRFGTGDDALLFAAVAGSGRAVEDGYRVAWEACRAIAAAVGRSHARLAEDIRASRRGSLKSGLQRLTERADGNAQASLHCLLLPVDPQCRHRIFFGAGTGGLFRLRDGEWQDLGPDRDPDPDPDPASESDAEPGTEGGSGPGSAPHVRFRFRASVARPGDTLLLCSSGLAEPLRDEPELAARLADRWGPSRPPPGIAAFLADSQTRVKGHADDRTAVAVWEG